MNDVFPMSNDVIIDVMLSLKQHKGYLEIQLMLPLHEVSEKLDIQVPLTKNKPISNSVKSKNTRIFY